MTDASISERIQQELVAAMKAKDADTLSTLRMLKSALMEAKTRKPREATLTPDEEIEVLQRYAKKRREQIEELRRLGREDLVPKEEAEIAVTQRFLPQAVGEDELRAIVRAAIEASGATSPKDLGRVMGLVLPQVKGRAEGGTVSRIVKESLGG